MNELLSDFIQARGYNTYPEYTIEEVRAFGSFVQFREVSMCRSHPDYFEVHEIELLDLLNWLYCKLKGDTKTNENK